MDFTHSAPIDTEEFRYERLYKVAQILSIIDPYFQHKILRLHDHKGDLNVGWKETADKDEIYVIEQVWGLFNECNVIHHVGDDF